MIPETSAAEAFPPRVGGRIPSLDGLRAVAILVVIESHLTGSTYQLPILGTGQFPLRFMLGKLGVRIFLVISGFLITTLLLKEHDKSGRISLREFYIRRALRILPASYTYVLIMGLATALGMVAIPRSSLVASIFYFRNYYVNRDWYTDHLWSLSIEEQFYLLWPAAMVLLGRRRALVVALCTLPLASLVRLVDPKRTFETNMDVLACGCILALAWGLLGQNDRWQRFLRSPLFWVIPIVILASTKLKAVGGASEAIGIGVANVLIAVSVERFVRYYNLGVAKVFNFRGAMIVGTLSYSLYLWQQPWIHHIDSRMQIFPINILLACICAVLSYILIERPFLRLRDRIKNGHLVAGTPVMT